MTKRELLKRLGRLEREIEELKRSLRRPYDDIYPPRVFPPRGSKAILPWATPYCGGWC